jgi:hypothetical protein
MSNLKAYIRGLVPFAIRLDNHVNITWPPTANLRRNTTFNGYFLCTKNYIIKKKKKKKKKKKTLSIKGYEHKIIFEIKNIEYKFETFKV